VLLALVLFDALFDALFPVCSTGLLESDPSQADSESNPRALTANTDLANQAIPDSNNSSGELELRRDWT
jgi:hypothetical protein